jgi:hypothetical protein
MTSLKILAAAENLKMDGYLPCTSLVSRSCCVATVVCFDIDALGKYVCATKLG